MKRPPFSTARLGTLLGIVIWSAHYHTGQWSREYRIGCRARKLITDSMEVGGFVLSRLFDRYEHVVTGEKTLPETEFSKAVISTYRKFAKTK